MCGICQARYAPSRSHEYLLQAPPIVLESAFMSMCHFCFRCRRPSCPDCWDDVHGVCGQCAEENHLPFRLEPVPLNGVPLVPSRQTVPEHTYTVQSSLINVRPGRFQMPTLPPIDRIPTRPDRSSVVEAQSAAESMSIDIDTIKTRPATRSKRSPAPPSSPDIDKIKTRPERIMRKTQRIGRVLTTIAFAILVIVMFLIIAALLSPDANAFISKILHIDIRAEIAYLWHLLQQLF
jgi:hypothetical protein